MTPFHIALARVTVRVGPDRRILFQVPSLKISSGERVLVKGASGQGKTTFLHLLAGLFTPDKGKVLVGDRRLDTLDEEARCRFRRKHVGIVFQKLNLEGSVFEVVASGDPGRLRPGLHEKGGKKEKPKPRTPPAGPPKLTFRQRQEVEQLPDRIEERESRWRTL